jgi:hypothetical protein
MLKLSNKISIRSDQNCLLGLLAREQPIESVAKPPNDIRLVHEDPHLILSFSLVGCHAARIQANRCLLTVPLKFTFLPCASILLLATRVASTSSY